MKGLLRMFTQGDRCTLLAGASGKHVEKFGHFKEFLGGNRNALRALAELEMLYYSGQSFTAADIAFQYEQLFGQVRALVNALNNLSLKYSVSSVSPEFEPPGSVLISVPLEFITKTPASKA